MSSKEKQSKKQSETDASERCFPSKRTGNLFSRTPRNNYAQRSTPLEMCVPARFLSSQSEHKRWSSEKIGRPQRGRLQVSPQFTRAWGEDRLTGNLDSSYVTLKKKDLKQKETGLTAHPGKYASVPISSGQGNTPVPQIPPQIISDQGPPGYLSPLEGYRRESPSNLAARTQKGEVNFLHRFLRLIPNQS